MKAQLLPAAQAVERAPHPFYNSVAGHAQVCPDVILPRGYSGLWAPCPGEHTVPSLRGILQAFGLAPFTLMHDKMSLGEFCIQSSSARGFPSLHRALLTEHQAQILSNTRAAYWKSSSKHQASRDGSLLPSRELHEPRLLVSNALLIPRGTSCFCSFFFHFRFSFFPEL